MIGDELPPGTISLEDDAPAVSADPPAPPEPVVEAPIPEAREVEPEHLVEAPDGKRLNVGPIIAAERKRIAEQKDREYEPIKQRTQQLEQEVQRLRQLAQPPAPEPAKEPDISDDEAAAEAKDLQLYTADSQPDIKTAKRIIQKRRQEALQVAEMVTARTLAPLQQVQAKDRSTQYFIASVTEKDQDGQPLFATRQEQEAFATFWAEQPDSLTSDPQAAEVFLNAYVGQRARTTKRAQPPPVRLEPIQTETPGGRGAPAYQMTAMDRKFANASGMTEKQYAEHTKGFQKDRTLIIGD